MSNIIQNFIEFNKYVNGVTNLINANDDYYEQDLMGLYNFLELVSEIDLIVMACIPYCHNLGYMEDNDE